MSARTSSSFTDRGHSTFSGTGHSFGSSQARAPKLTARMSGGFTNGGLANSGRSPDRSYAGNSGFSSRSSGNFAGSNFGRNSGAGRGSFGSEMSSGNRNLGRSEASPAAGRDSQDTRGWHSFGNSAGRETPASARTFGRSAGDGWHSFGNDNRGGGTELPHGVGSVARDGGQWHSFGNARNTSWDANGSRFSSFSSFSSGRAQANFGSSRFSSTGFGGSDFGNSSAGFSGFSNSFLGSNISLIPSLLLNGLLRFGTSGFGGWGLLGGSALSLAVRSLDSLVGANEAAQCASPVDDSGWGSGGVGSGYGVGPAFGPSYGFGGGAGPVSPDCAAGTEF